MRRLQSVFNAAARLISNKRKFNHITPVIWTYSTGFPFASGSNSRSRSSSATPSMVGGPTYLSLTLQSCPGGRRQGSSAVCCAGRPDCLEPRPFTLGLVVSVSLDRLFGTHCPRTLEFQNCRWNVFKSMLKTHYFAKHIPSSAFVTWLGGAQ